LRSEGFGKKGSGFSNKGSEFRVQEIKEKDSDNREPLAPQP
jgi:hypothetical protein